MEIAELTRMQYDADLRRVMAKTGLTLIQMENAVETCKIVRELPMCQGTRQNYICAILYALRNVHYKEKETVEKTYKDEIRRYSEEIKKAKDAKDNTLSEKEAAKFLTWDELQKATDKLALLVADGKEPLENLLLLKFYTSSGVVARNDFARLNLVDFDAELDSDKNYVIIGDKCQLVLNQYKTFKKYGTFVADLSEEVSSLIRVFYEKGDRVLFNVAEVTLAGRMIKLMKRITGKGCGISQIRHAYASHILKDVPKLSEMQKSASNMGHSVLMHLDYVRR